MMNILVNSALESTALNYFRIEARALGTVPSWPHRTGISAPRNILVYLVDIVIFSKTPEKHFDCVEQLLTLLTCAGVIFELKNCPFFVNKIDFPRHVIQPRRPGIDAHTTDAFRRL